MSKSLPPPKQLTDDKVKMGVLLPVENLKRDFGQLATYTVMHVQTNDNREFPLLFTDTEIRRRFREVHGKMFESIKPGHLHLLSISSGSALDTTVKSSSVARSGFVTKIVFSKREAHYFLIPGKLIDKARARAEKQKENIPRKSLLTNLFD